MKCERSGLECPVNEGLDTQKPTCLGCPVRHGRFWRRKSEILRKERDALLVKVQQLTEENEHLLDCLADEEEGGTCV